MLSIVIVNWNSGEAVSNLVRGVLNDAGRVNWLPHVIVVDNASSDDSLNHLNELSTSVELVASSTNLGFAGGCNLGAAYAKEPLILFLNPDTEINLDTLNKVIDFMAHPVNEEIGILGIQLLDEAGNITRSSARFPRASMFLAQNLALDRFFPKLGHTMKEWAHDQTREVDQVIGAFFLTRRSLFNLLGGFDDRFFVYFEEVDYAYRAKKLGFKSVYLADAQAFHEGEGTTAQIKGRRLFYLLRSRLLYGRKHYGLPENLLNFVNTLVLEPVSRAAFLTLSGRRDELPALKEGFALLYQDLPNILFRKMRP